jgi:hypothetical protein
MRVAQVRLKSFKHGAADRDDFSKANARFCGSPKTKGASLRVSAVSGAANSENLTINLR